MRKLILLFLIITHCGHAGASKFDNPFENQGYYVYAIVNDTGDTIFYPSLEDQIYIGFTEDSLYLETVCYNTKPGTSYNNINDSVIETDTLLTPLECLHPDQDLVEWNTEVICLINNLAVFVVSGNYLAFHVGDKTLILITSGILGNNAISNDFEDEILMHYTNDNKGELKIHFNLPPTTKNTLLKIYDISGRIILTEVVTVIGKSMLNISNKIPSAGILYALYTSAIGRLKA